MTTNQKRSSDSETDAGQYQPSHRHPQSLPIWRDSQRLLVHLELVVAGFPRYHKYALGSDLRRQALLIMRLLGRALNEPKSQRRVQVKRLQQSIDDIKIMIQSDHWNYLPDE